MSDWRTGYRSERMEYRLLSTSSLRAAGLLTGVESCSLSGSVFSDVRWGGSLTWSGSSMPNLSTLLVHPWYIVAGTDGVEESFPLCPPCYMKTPTVNAADAIPATVKVDLYDVTYTLAKRFKLASTLGISAGAVITDTIGARLAATGVRYGVAPSAKTLTTAMNFDIGASEMSVLNQLLGALGYWSTYASAEGVVQAQPWVDPSQRPVAWAFAPGAVNILDPATTRTLDDFDTPNRITGVARATAPAAPLVATVTLDSFNPASPYSYASRGYYVDAEPMRDVDAADATALSSVLVQKLQALTSVGATNTVTHAWVPEVTLGSLVTSSGVRNAVQKMSLKVDTGLQVKAEWAEVA
ncbi:hypothetical protein [Tessaracoccus sp.]